MTVRINARLDKKLAGRVAALRRRTGKTLTQVIEESLHRYCQSQAIMTPFDALAATGFVGCADGPKNLSVRYQDQLRRTLVRKA